MTDGVMSLNDLLNFTPKQDEAFKSMFKYKYTLYGGARGGGKSRFLRWGMVAWLIYQAKMGFRGIVGGLFSSTYDSLRDRQINKISEEFPSWLGTLLDRKKSLGLGFYLDKKFGGGCIALRNLDAISKYKSAEFGIIGVDELTEHTVETFDTLRGSLRWAGLATPCFIAGSNPDGIGNDWVKNYFIYHQYPKELEELSGKFNFVKSLPTDNPYLNDEYWHELRTQPADIRKAWLDGDWDVFKGLAFKTFSRAKHVIEPIEIPDYWTRVIGVDSGYRAPFCALFGARNPDNGRVVVYKEIYETELTDRQQARRILDLSDDKELKAMRYGDPSMWTRKTQEFVTSTAQVYAQNGVYLQKGNNDRMDGKRKVDRLLLDMEDGRPGLLIFNTCPNLVKQMAQLVYDKYHSEDVDTRMEDHAYDAMKYLLTTVRDYKKVTKPHYQKSPLLALERI
jgi:phage terminase large subunit